MYSVAMSWIGRVGTKLSRLVWFTPLAAALSWIRRPSCSSRVHMAVLGRACNIPIIAWGMPVRVTNSTMRLPAPRCSPSKPMMKPAITRRPLAVIFSTDSSRELRVFCSLRAVSRLAASGVSIPRNTLSKRHSVIRSISS